MSTTDPHKRFLVYDGQCPFCSRYIALLRLRKSLGPVELIDARSGHPVAFDLMARGYDLDDGMVLVDADNIYHGKDCINRLALMTTPIGLFNRINAAIFRSRQLSALLYPVLRTGRNVTLRLLGRRRIADTHP
jgi:predicted DCC family thiol-disulfide oxidoreductase YuxK